MPHTTAHARDPIPELKRQAGAELAVLLAGWNADDIAALIGTDRARISELRRGKLERFSLEALIRFLTRLGRRVELRTSDPRATRVPRVPPGA
jgi:hypothetical protein